MGNASFRIQRRFRVRGGHETKSIQAFLETDDTKADFLLQKVSETENLSAEDQFVNNIVQKAQTAINDLDGESSSNSMTAVIGLMKSGILTDMIVGLQTQVGSGQMDSSRLLQSMQGTMAKVLNDTTLSLGESAESVNSSNVTRSSEKTGKSLPWASTSPAIPGATKTHAPPHLKFFGFFPWKKKIMTKLHNKTNASLSSRTTFFLA